MSAKGKSAGVSETSFCGLQRGRSGLVGGGEWRRLQLDGKGKI